MSTSAPFQTRRTSPCLRQPQFQSATVSIWSSMWEICFLAVEGLDVVIQTRINGDSNCSRFFLVWMLA